MKRKRIGICDREEVYGRRFMEYVNQQPDALFLAWAFTDWEELRLFAAETFLDILLVSEVFSGEDVKGLGVGQVMLLKEERYQEKELDYPPIWKYQSADRILRRMFSLYAEASVSSWGSCLRERPMKVLGVYSPVGRCGKTAFALALGKELAKRRKTLYLNLEEYSGFASLYPSGEEGGLSELLYFLKQKKGAFACKLAEAVRRLGGLCYVPPLKSPEELKQVEEQDWALLLRALERETEYEMLLLDLSSTVNGLFYLLGSCDRIYMPVEEDEVSRAKLKQYEEALRLEEMEEVLERTCRLTRLEGQENWGRQVLREVEQWTMD